ncbi:hypothetical protein CCZ01_07980 [Helicobacter monodelphidis]|uniref:MATE family efflux transporter n=1 Tax=Helicobacter sp. 15-1451 TaxID=2004995 RepID=UPI000DCDF2A6|nr:MATE family efflux transporter [Helicobacter sp. 15-1451]RAX56871.1 hypothetical protein CCZ01_07980 [Helicobacter sp. 15-1451]
MANVIDSKINLEKDSIPKLFFTYFIPSVCAMLALSTNTTIDGIFVGQKIGTDALAAVGIAWPIFPVIIAYELLFSIGAASLSSYYIGKGKAQKARMIFSSVFYFALVSALVMGLVFYYFRYEMALFLGVSQTLLPLVVEYIGVIFLGGVFIVLQPLLDIFAINDRRPNLAMIAMIASSVINIIFNYIFIFLLEWGLFGAAFATILGHIVGFFILLRHFISRRGHIYFIRYFHIRAILVSAKNGVPQATSEVSASLMMLTFNHVLKEIVGDRGNSIYSIVMYIGIIVFTILLSSAQGVQPISSFNYGANRLERVRAILKFGIFFSSIAGVILYICSVFFDRYLIMLFLSQEDMHNDPMLLTDVSLAIRIYFIGFILLGFNFVVATLLQSIQRPLNALIVTVSSTLIFAIPFVLILPKYFGINGIWASYPLAMVCASFIAIIVISYELRKGVLAQKEARQ